MLNLDRARRDLSHASTGPMKSWVELTNLHANHILARAESCYFHVLARCTMYILPYSNQAEFMNLGYCAQHKLSLNLWKLRHLVAILAAVMQEEQIYLVHCCWVSLLANIWQRIKLEGSTPCWQAFRIWWIGGSISCRTRWNYNDPKKLHYSFHSHISHNVPMKYLIFW